ncbi:MAG: MHYT domain-containing protein [Castellaniella sp.]|uniref:MHYT domain-containing protein n=1 Tax=Castellaniella sp. TaxID=1955812 RepID=UPI003C70DF68
MMTLDHFFVTGTETDALVQGSWQPGLVLLSVVVPIFLSMMALQTSHIARNTPSPYYRHVAIGTGAVALGGGIWTMHFIGMLAFHLPAPMIYRTDVTLVSLLPGLVASWTALWMLTRREPTGWPLVIGGVVVGAGIGAMHYIGMAAMVTPLDMRYDPLLFGLSIVVAVVLAMLALWIRFGLRRTPLSRRTRFMLSGVIMGVAIAGMHYIGMAAVRFYGVLSGADTEHGVWLGTTWASLGLASISLTVTVLVTSLNGLIRTRELYREVGESQSRLQAILDTAVDAIITIDGDGIVQEFSHSAERLFGYQAQEVIGHNIKILMPEPYHSEHDGYLQRYRATGVPHIIGLGREVIGRRKDGSLVPVRLAVGRVPLPNQEQLFVGMLTDISDKQAMEASLRETAERAEQAAAAKGHFLANMSHEIRTPMNSIIGFTDLLLQTDLAPAQRGHLNIIRQSSRNLLRLLNDILDTSKMDSGRLELENRDFSLKALALQIESSLRLGAQARDLRLTTQYPADMPEYFKGDTLRLLQVLTNLVGNAIKFTETGGVDVLFSLEGGVVHVQVCDTGIGMSPAQVQAIFDPFTQADASISRRFGGTGLGTTIARQLVEAMKGRIEVESEPGRGSTFHVWLPLAPGEAPAEPQASGEAPQLPPLRVLIADDVEQNLDLLTLVLQSGGHTVEAARDGEQAVELFLAGRFDVVLMDVHMPRVDGLQATRLIRQHERTQGLGATPVIALTASVMANDRREARQAGMSGFAVKPLDIPRLFEEIARVLEGRPETGSGPMVVGRAVVSSIDWERGMALWGDRARLADRILAFLDEAPDKYPLPDVGEHADPEALLFSLHGLRGAAGNLALMALSQQAGELEDLGRTSGSLDGVSERLPHLRALMEVARQAARSVRRSASAAPGSEAHAAPSADAIAAVRAPLTIADTDLEAAVAALRTVLASNALDDAALDVVCAGLGERGGRAQAQALRTAVDAFEFERAGQLLESIPAEIAAHACKSD